MTDLRNALRGVKTTNNKQLLDYGVYLFFYNK